MNQFDSIPEELRGRKQWLNWRRQEDGRQTKAPIGTNGLLADVTDPAAYMTFEDAVSRSDKVGFAFTPSDPYCGIDLDQCRDSETGEVEPWALEIVHDLNSYTEVSCGGCGLHVLVKAQLPPWGSRKGQVEMYDRDRYFCMTGNLYDGSPTTIENRQLEIGKLHAHIFPKSENTSIAPLRRTASTPLPDEGVIAKAQVAKNGEAFSKLWQGETEGYTSPSEADMALCLHLAFWSGCDRAQMDRLFRLSGLMREKWDEQRGEKTFGWKTIDKAVLGCTEVYSPEQYRPIMTNGTPTKSRKRPLIKTLDELLSIQFPPLRWIVPDLIPPGLTFLVAPTKTGKSFLSLQLGFAAASGGEFLGQRLEPAGVLYVALEDSERRLQDRERLLRGGAGLSNFHYATEWDILTDSGLEDLEQFLDEEPSVRLVMFDTWGRVRTPHGKYSYGRDVHDLKDLQRLTLDREIAVVLVHHTNKNSEASDYTDTASGTMAVVGTADTALFLNRPRGMAIGSLKATGRDILEVAYAVEFRPEDGGWFLIGDLEQYQQSEQRKAIIEHLKATGVPMGPKQIADALGKNVSTTTNLLIKMVSAGQVKKEGPGKYTYNPVETVENVENAWPDAQGISTPSMFSTDEESLA